MKYEKIMGRTYKIGSKAHAIAKQIKAQADNLQNSETA